MAENGHSVSSSFYESGTVAQWKYVLSQYRKVLKVKADRKPKGGKELIKLDTWYHDQLPDLINKRSERHLTHEEIVKVMKWKLLRGKFRPRLTDLIKTNTPLAVKTATKRGFKRMPNLSQAINALVTLKGVGPAMASAILAAGHKAAFMSDEAMLSIPEITSVDYTTNEYLKYAGYIQRCVDRLNDSDENSAWNPHIVEKTLWTHYLAKDLDPSVLDNIPKADGTPNTEPEKTSVNGQTITEDSVSSVSDVQDGEELSDTNTKADNGEESSDANTKADNGEESSDVNTKADNGEESSDANIKADNGEESSDANTKAANGEESSKEDQNSQDSEITKPEVEQNGEKPLMKEKIDGNCINKDGNENHDGVDVNDAENLNEPAAKKLKV